MMKRLDWVEVNGTSLRYELSGEGPHTLVLVHEMGGTLESWDQVLPALLPGRRILRYDTRGAGQSEKIRDGVSFDEMAEDLAALLDTLGITEQVALAGCAVGGGIVLHFAARFPERVAALVAMGPATGVPPDRRAATLARAEAIERTGPRGVIEESFAGSYPPEVRHDAEQYRRFRARWLANDAKSYGAIYRMLVDSTVTEEIAGIACPALLLAGTKDRLRPPAVVEPLAGRMRNARFRALDTGHFMAVQTPALVAGEIDGFLASLGR
ncbi:MAG: alpha/beta fold hydrolase [Rhodospirillales bacterium]|nr:alpha/beta fold hydrolase [Rhodospirillales bacterium]